MDTRRTCTSCGGKDFFRFKVSSSGSNMGDAVNVSVGNASTYACAKCGHLEWFLTEKALDDYRHKERQAAEYKRNLTAYEEKAASLQREINGMLKIIADDNQTFKTINEAKEILTQLETELRALHRPEATIEIFGTQ